MLETLMEQGWADYLFFALAVVCLYLVWRFTPLGNYDPDSDEGGFWSWFLTGDDDSDGGDGD